MDAGLNTWNAYSSETRAQVGRVNVHGYWNGTEPYHGPNRVELRRAAAVKPRWLSEYGDGDASGYTMAEFNHSRCERVATERMDLLAAGRTRRR